MNYPTREASDPNDGIVEVREPVAAYAYATMGAAAGSRPGVYDDDDDFDGGDDWFDRALREDPELEEALVRELEQAAAGIKAGQGRMYAPEEFSRKLWQDIKEDSEADIAAGLMPPQPQEYWDLLERKIGK